MIYIYKFIKYLVDEKFVKILKTGKLNKIKSGLQV